MEHLSCQVKAKDSFTKGFNRSKFNEFNAKKKYYISFKKDVWVWHQEEKRERPKKQNSKKQILLLKTLNSKTPGFVNQQGVKLIVLGEFLLAVPI